MSKIHVCGLSRLRETVEQSGAHHIVSLINEGMDVPYPLSVPVSQRLRLGFNDIVEEVPGLKPPEYHHAEALISYVREWDQKAPLVIHCWMGISRSTAGGYIAQCTLMPEEDELELAHSLRKTAPEATPNIRLIQFADQILERNGRMISAIESIGRGEDAFEGTPFSLPISSK